VCKCLFHRTGPYGGLGRAKGCRIAPSFVFMSSTRVEIHSAGYSRICARVTVNTNIPSFRTLCFKHETLDEDSYFQNLKLKLSGAFIFWSISFCLINNFKRDLPWYHNYFLFVKHILIKFGVYPKKYYFPNEYLYLQDHYD
jgi:hypothetical protein